MCNQICNLELVGGYSYRFNILFRINIGYRYSYRCRLWLFWTRYVVSGILFKSIRGWGWLQPLRVPNGVFQTVFFKFLTWACDTDKSLQTDEDYLKTTVFSSIWIPPAVADPDDHLNTPLWKTPFRKHRLLLLSNRLSSSGPMVQTPNHWGRLPSSPVFVPPNLP